MNKPTRNQRRHAIATKRARLEWSAWPESEYQLGVGHITTLSDTRRRKKKHPLGFTGGTK